MQEQYDLKRSQFQRVPVDLSIYDSSTYYLYTEFVSKNNQHRFKDIDSSNKCVRCYAQPGSEKCVVKLLDAYLKCLPLETETFYMRPLTKFSVDPSKPSYGKQRVGITTLKKIVPDICQKSGCNTKYTNHSLRATAITRMFNGGLPEKLIAENSGHRSLKALRQYEHTSSEQQKLVSETINNPEQAVRSSTSPILASVEFKESVTSTVPITGSSSSGCIFTGNLSNCTINISK